MPLPPRFILALLTLLFPAAVCAAPAPPDLLAPGGWHLTAPHPGDVQLEEAIAPGRATETLTVVTPSQPPEQFYLEQIIRTVPRAVPAGHRLELRFQARSATRNPLRASVEQNGPPYTAALDLTAALNPQWQTFVMRGIAPGYGPNGLSAHFQVGQQAGVVELKQIRLSDLGPDPAVAETKAALIPSAIQARIRKYRMGTLTVRVVGSSGKPVPNAQVQITQTRHAFLFGCNAFGYGPADTSPAQKAYRDQFTALFNYATVPFYWGAFEAHPGQPDYARLQAMADWCVAHNIDPKGHPLVWHQVWPQWAPQTADAAIPLLHARVADLVPRYKNTIHYWDVLNEANSAAAQAPPNGESEWIKRDGPAPVVETALGWARSAGKGQTETFLYNDYETGSANLALLTRLQHDGKLPDAIGIQSHMHGGVWPIPKVWTTCQSFSQFGRPIHFTETTVLSGPSRTVDFNAPDATDWNTTPAGEAAQADYLIQFYTVLFSHPSVRAITWWDFSDKGAWLGAPAGLLRRDMTPKPAYTRLLNLIHHQWWTHAVGTTDTRGLLPMRVFYGQYTVTARVGGTRQETQVFFPEASGPVTVTVRLPSKKHA